MAVRWSKVGRDAIIILVLNRVGEWVTNYLFKLGLLGDFENPNWWAFWAIGAFFPVVGFTVVACLAKTRRFMHGFLVLAGVLVLELAYILLLGRSIFMFMHGMPFFLVYMLAGTGISYIITRPEEENIYVNTEPPPL